MPALVILGRQLRLGSDDLALPSAVGAFWQGAWAALAALDLAFVVRHLSHACPYRVKHMAFLATLLGVLVVAASLHVAIIWESTKGSLFQVRRRRFVGPLLLALVACHLAAAGSNVYGSCLLAQHHDFRTQAACALALPGPLEHLHHISLLKAIVVATWVQLFVSAIIGLIVFRLLPNCSSTSCFVRRLHLTLLCCTCCCIQLVPDSDEGRGSEERAASRTTTGTTAQDDCIHNGDGGGRRGGEQQMDPPVVVIARVLLHAFGGVDMTLTDYVTALTLVGVRHRHTKVAHTYSTAPPPAWLPLPHCCAEPLSVLLRPPVVMTLQADARAAQTPSRSSSTAGRAYAPDNSSTTTQPLQQSVITQQRPQPQPTSAEVELPAVRTPAPTVVAPQPASSTATSGATDLPTTSTPAASPTAAHSTVHRLSPIEPSTNRYINVTSQASAVTPSQTGSTVGTALGGSAVASMPANDPQPPSSPNAPDQQPKQEPLPFQPLSYGCGRLLASEFELSPATSRVFGMASLPSGETPALLHPQREWSGQREASNATAEVLEEALNYFRFATAVYGWVMYLYLNRTRVIHCCSLCLGRGCGCCRQSAYFLRSVGPDTGPPEATCTPVKLLEREAITRVAGVPDSDILYVSYTNKIGGLLPYYIALDRERRSVVVTVRGSWSADDVITDCLCEPAPLPIGTSEDASDRRILWAHRGILDCARAIDADIKAQGVLAAVLAEWPDAEQQGTSEAAAATTGWLSGLPSERARTAAARLQGQCAGWRLVLTGHSLGAGVAALVGLLLRPLFPGLRCWAFAPPGGLLSPQAVELTREFCVSVVHGKDIIPRLSVATGEQLVQELLTAGAHCRLSKAAVLCRLMALGQQPNQSRVFRPAEELCAEQRAALDGYCSRMQEHAARSRLAGARGFQPPGHLLYIERHPRRRGPAGDSGAAAAGLDSDLRAEASSSGGCCGGGVRCSCNVCLLETSAKGAQYTCRFIRAEDLMAGGLVISRSMLTDHFPDHMLWGMEQAYHQAREAGGLLTRPSSLRMPAALPSRIWKHSRSGCRASVAPIPGASTTTPTPSTAMPLTPVGTWRRPESEAAAAAAPESGSTAVAPAAAAAAAATAAAAHVTSAAPAACTTRPPGAVAAGPADAVVLATKPTTAAVARVAAVTATAVSDKQLGLPLGTAAAANQ